MSKRANVTAIVNQKGGTGKTQTTENLGVGLAKEGKKVLLVDLDPQASLTISLGNPMPDNLENTVSDMMIKVISEDLILPKEGVISNFEGVDLMPSNISLAAMEVNLVSVMSRETILKQYIDTVKDQYDHILIDCSPSLGMLTINALAAADDIIIPCQPQYLSIKGLEQLLGTISKVKRQINPKLKIEGILLTMVDSRTNYNRNISEVVRDTYGKNIRIFESEIPTSVRAAEISAEAKSIYEHDPKGKVADAYRSLTKEVLKDAEIRRKHIACELR